MKEIMKIESKSSVITGVLLEEQERNLAMQQQYQKEISELPKGSIIKKRRKSGDYYYRSYRDGEKVVSVYLGSDIEKVEKIRQQVEKRKYLEGLVKRLKNELKIILRAVK